MNGQPDQERENPDNLSSEPDQVEPVKVVVPNSGLMEDWTPESGPLVTAEDPWHQPRIAVTTNEQAAQEQPMFQQWYAPPPVRIPHFGHFAMLMAFLVAGFFATGIAMAFALRFHWFGLHGVPTNLTDIDIRLALGSEVLAYAVMFGAALIFFPLIWHKGFFAGIQWNAETALRRRKQIFITALICFALALINGLWISGPKNAPIEKIFRTPGAAWWLFGFGISLAPFFEEMIFRGFLLPAMCTAFDWLAEKFASADERRIDADGRLHWSHSAIIKVALIFASGPIVFVAAHQFFSTLVFVLVVLSYVSVMAIFLTVVGLAKTKTPRLSPTFDSNGHPLWSLPALIAGSLAASVPFAGMHAAQTGYSVGVFGLLVCISLVFCWVRLSTRSLAASTLLHATYNFLLFSMMLASTGGFRHMDKL